jgi:Lon protease-like protein
MLRGISLFPLQDVVLFPGETLPLRIRGLEAEMFSHTLATEGTLDIVVTLQSSGNYQGRIGVLVRTRAHERDEAERELRLIAKGMRRVRIRNCRRLRHASLPVLIGWETDAFLLDDLTHPQPFASDSCRQHACDPFPLWVHSTREAVKLTQRATDLYRSSNLHGETSDEQYDSVHSSPPPPLSPSPSPPALSLSSSSSSQYSTNEFSFGSSLGGKIYQRHLDPTRQAFFLSAMLPLPSSQRYDLLCCESTTERLLMLIQHLEMWQKGWLACRACGHIVTSKQEVFSVPGAEGAVGAYVNPHGCVHQTLTTRRVCSPLSSQERHHILLEGEPTAQDSWFPGYAWVIVYCRNCGSHLGWKFSSCEAEGEETSSASGITQNIQDRQGDTSTDNVVAGAEDMAFFGLRQGAVEPWTGSTRGNHRSLRNTGAGRLQGQFASSDFTAIIDALSHTDDVVSSEVLERLHSLNAWQGTSIYDVTDPDSAGFTHDSESEEDRDPEEKDGDDEVANEDEASVPDEQGRTPRGRDEALLRGQGSGHLWSSESGNSVSEEREEDSADDDSVCSEDFLECEILNADL